MAPARSLICLLSHGIFWKAKNNKKKKKEEEKDVLVPMSNRATARTEGEQHRVQKYLTEVDEEDSSARGPRSHHQEF